MLSVGSLRWGATPAAGPPLTGRPIVRPNVAEKSPLRIHHAKNHAQRRGPRLSSRPWRRGVPPAGLPSRPCRRPSVRLDPFGPPSRFGAPMPRSRRLQPALGSLPNPPTRRVLACDIAGRLARRPVGLASPPAPSARQARREPRIWSPLGSVPPPPRSEFLQNRGAARGAVKRRRYWVPISVKRVYVLPLRLGCAFVAGRFDGIGKTIGSARRQTSATAFAGRRPCLS